jgi:hypothetical protein
VDELDLAVVLAIPPPPQAGLQATNDHVDRPLGLLERAVGVVYLRWGRQVALVVAVFWLLVIMSPVVTAVVVSAATSVVVAVVVVATRGWSVTVASGSLQVFGRAERPLELLALANSVGAPFMERTGAVQHHVELLDIERRWSATICLEHLGRSLEEL